MPCHKKDFDSKSIPTPKAAPTPGLPIPLKDFEGLKEEAKKPAEGRKGSSDPSIP